jgi:hypothetical protein
MLVDRRPVGTTSYRFEFGRKVPLKKVEESLLLAMVVVESLHGRSAVRLGVSFYLDEKERSCVVDASTEVGLDLARILTGFLAEEFGEDAFKVTRDCALGSSRAREEKALHA